MATRTGPPDHHVVIGIDLGSTFSRVAFAVLKSPPGSPLSRVLKGIAVVGKWPHNDAMRQEHSFEVKSAVYFSDQPGQEIVWGNSVPDIAPDIPRQAIGFFKLLMLPNPQIPKSLQESEFFCNAERMARLCGKQAEEVTASFLRCLWEHARRYMMNHMPPGFLNPSFHFVITLPANWPEAARDSMHRALDLGIGLNNYSPRTLSFITEPDAAVLEAAATLSTLRNTSGLTEGDAFTIVDAGGTTVDLVTYRVGATDPLEINQCVRPVAIPAGGAFVDDAFEMAVRRKAAELFPSEPMLSYQEMKRIFALQLPRRERVALLSSSSFKLTLPSRFDGATPANSGPYKPLFATILFTPQDIQSIFVASGIREISQAVALQANTANASSRGQTIVKFVYMVGGYSNYDYLLQWLHKEHGGARVIYRPTNTGSSISLATVRGAVIHGLNTVGRSMNVAPAVKVTVLHLTSRASFGICCSDYRGRQVPEPNISWILNMGHAPGDHMASGEIILTFSENTAVVSIKVYACTANPYPAVVTPEVEEFATLAIPVNRDSFHSLECEQGSDGTTLYHLRVEILMGLHPTNGLVIRALHQGKALIDDQIFSTVGY